MSDAIRFLRDRIEKSLPLYQGDIDSALAQAIQEDRAGRAVQDGLDPERLIRVLAEHRDASSYHETDTNGCDEECAADLLARLAPSKPVIGEVDQ